jgi:hypothetical protein
MKAGERRRRRRRRRRNNDAHKGRFLPWKGQRPNGLCRKPHYKKSYKLKYL